MSQHRLMPLNPRHEVTIGWDPPLWNFFLQVHDLDVLDDEADPVIVWLGADGLATEPDVDRVLKEAAKWAIIPDHLRDQLQMDERLEGRRHRPVYFSSL
jgi:hypothetical protein